MLSLLFVCSANIVRSPAFEAYMRFLIDQKGFSDKVIVDSCGLLESTRGSSPSLTMAEIAKKEGVVIDHMAKPFIDAYFDQFDALFAVDRTVFDALFARAHGTKNEKKLYLTAQFSQTKSQEVDNPYGEGSSYLRAWQLIKEHSESIFNHYVYEKITNSY